MIARPTGIRLVLAAALAALALAAPSFAAAPSAWAVQANAICERTNAAIDKIPSPSTTKELIASTTAALALGVRQTNEIARLPRPAAAQATIAELVAVYRQQVDLVARLIVALRSKGLAGTQKLIAAGDKLHARAVALERRLGAATCTK